MNKLIPFHFGTSEVRVIQDDSGEHWWIVSDVCQILGLSNPSEAIRGLDDDEKSTLRISEGGPERNIINEAGLYTLIIRSNKPEAKEFKRWITHKVLPSIRKTGKYEVGTQSELELIIRSAKALKVVQQKQNEHDGRLAALEAKANQNSGHTGYWTIIAWCKLNDLSLSLDQAMSYGREATKLSRHWCVEIGKVHDERFGEVNSYREDVLEEVFSNSAQSVRV
jgi:prophage antirepressor-like protein